MPAGRAQPEGALFPRVALGHKLCVKASLADTYGVLQAEGDRDDAAAATTRLGDFLLTDQACTVELTTGADGAAARPGARYGLRTGIGIALRSASLRPSSHTTTSAGN